MNEEDLVVERKITAMINITAGMTDKMIDTTTIEERKSKLNLRNTKKKKISKVYTSSEKKKCK